LLQGLQFAKNSAAAILEDAPYPPAEPASGRIFTMTEISYQGFKQKLEAGGAVFDQQTFVFWGEAMLRSAALEGLLGVFLPEAQRHIGCERFEGAEENIPAAIESVRTHALLSGPKVVVLKDSAVFRSRHDKAAMLLQARAAVAEDALGKGADFLLRVMALMDLSWEDLTPLNRARALGLAAEKDADQSWLDSLIEYCRQRDLAIPDVADAALALERAVQRDFPKGNLLVITTDKIDRRARLYKIIKDSGLIVDCSVPKGERKSDRAVRNALLQEQAAGVLSASGKKLEPEAYNALVERIGFDLDTFRHNLEKLIDYTGERPRIAAEDVAAVVRRTRQDPLYAFTDAFTDRDAGRCLFYLHTLLSEGGIEHPLQLLAAMVNQVRKLLMVWDFRQSEYGGVWNGLCSYARFQAAVVPALQAYEQQLQEHIAGWDLDSVTPPRQGASPAKQRRKAVSDLQLLKQNRSSYPVYKLFAKSEAYTREELIQLLDALSLADQRIKSGTGEARLALEQLVLRFGR
jgi:DNA polymerase-3 subunit delta